MPIHEHNLPYLTLQDESETHRLLSRWKQKPRFATSLAILETLFDCMNLQFEGFPFLIMRCAFVILLLGAELPMDYWISLFFDLWPETRPNGNG